MITSAGRCRHAGRGQSSGVAITGARLPGDQGNRWPLEVPARQQAGRGSVPPTVRRHPSLHRLCRGHHTVAAAQSEWVHVGAGALHGLPAQAGAKQGPPPAAPDAEGRPRLHPLLRCHYPRTSSHLHLRLLLSLLLTGLDVWPSGRGSHWKAYGCRGGPATPHALRCFLELRTIQPRFC